MEGTFTAVGKVCHIADIPTEVWDSSRVLLTVSILRKRNRRHLSQAYPLLSTLPEEGSTKKLFGSRCSPHMVDYARPESRVILVWGRTVTRAEDEKKSHDSLLEARLPWVGGPAERYDPSGRREQANPLRVPAWASISYRCDSDQSLYVRLHGSQDVCHRAPIGSRPCCQRSSEDSNGRH